MTIPIRILVKSLNGDLTVYENDPTVGELIRNENDRDRQLGMRNVISFSGKDADKEDKTYRLDGFRDNVKLREVLATYGQVQKIDDGVQKQDAFLLTKFTEDDPHKLRVLVGESGKMTLEQYEQLIEKGGNLSIFNNGWLINSETYQLVDESNLTPNCQFTAIVTPLSLILNGNTTNDVKKLKAEMLITKISQLDNLKLLKQTALVLICRSEWDSLSLLVDWFPQVSWERMLERVVIQKMSGYEETIEDPRVWAAFQELIQRDLSNLDPDLVITRMKEYQEPPHIVWPVLTTVLWTVGVMAWCHSITGYLVYYGYDVHVWIIAMCVLALGLLGMLLFLALKHRRERWKVPLFFLTILSIVAGVITGWYDVAHIFKNSKATPTP
jgi:hypothetical protein